ncbi:MAG: hypothetical protein Q4D06_01435 [Coriobacteriia bacterium]|nr:hypothetical protein [Coriobacteriia bacterium]
MHRDRCGAGGSFAPHAFDPQGENAGAYLGNDMFRYPAEGRDPHHVVGKPHDDRARQFVPFMALKGYHQMVRELEVPPEPRRPRSDQDARELAERMLQLTRGQLVRVTYYDHDHYGYACDRVRQVDTALRTLRLESTAVPFDQIDQVQTEGD